MVKYGFDELYTKRCIEANKHNPATTAYYLLLQKYIREGGTSLADISSPLFEPVTIGNQLHTLRNMEKNSSNKKMKPIITMNPYTSDINKTHEHPKNRRHINTDYIYMPEDIDRNLASHKFNSAILTTPNNYLNKTTVIFITNNTPIHPKFLDRAEQPKAGRFILL